MVMVFGRRLLSDKPSPFTLAARTEDADRLARLAANSGARLIAKSSCCAFKRTYRYRRSPRRCGSAGLYRRFKNLIKGWQRCRPQFEEKQHEPPRKFPAHDRRESGGHISAEREQSLREHLDTCAPCQEYLSASNRGYRGRSAVVPLRWIQPSMPGFSRPSGDPRSGSRPRSQTAGDGVLIGLAAACSQWAGRSSICNSGA